MRPFSITKSYAALRAADLDWIVQPGYSSGRYILKKNHEKPTWNHEKLTWNPENRPETNKNHEIPTWNHKKRPGTMNTHKKPA